jgi:hypothetical protein
MASLPPDARSTGPRARVAFIRRSEEVALTMQGLKASCKFRFMPSALSRQPLMSTYTGQHQFVHSQCHLLHLATRSSSRRSRFFAFPPIPVLQRAMCGRDRKPRFRCDHQRGMQVPRLLRLVLREHMALQQERGIGQTSPGSLRRSAAPSDPYTYSDFWPH